jgi:hypothetical protein
MRDITSQTSKTSDQYTDIDCNSSSLIPSFNENFWFVLYASTGARLLRFSPYLLRLDNFNILYVSIKFINLIKMSK